jgi:hypothetical protein
MLNADIEIGLTDFEVAEIDLIVESDQDQADPDDALPAETDQIVSQVGDLWHSGNHRILCGDSKEDSNFAAVMQSQWAVIVFVDPPYNVAINGHATGNGKTHHPEFAMASGEMSEVEFTDFLTTALTRLAAWSSNGSVHYVAMDFRHMTELLAAGRKVYDSLLNLCVWTKDNGGMGSLYRSQHELIFVFRNGKVQHRNNIQLGKFGRYRTNVWR